jgi:nucleoside-diphosphate-sugar epimerase
MGAAPVMVIGGAGFLGAHVCELLAEKGFLVVSFDLGSGAARAGVEFFHGDVLSLQSLTDCASRFRVRGVIHLAATGNEAAAREHPLPALNLNVQGTINVVEACRLQEIERLVYVSTGGVYGRREERQPAVEDDPITWRRTLYHPSHYIGEILVDMYREVYGLDAVNLRPLAFYGPAATASNKEEHLRRKSLFFGPWLLKLLKGEEVEVRNCDTLWDLTFVKDVAQGVCLAYAAENPQRRLFNIGSGVLISYRDIAAAIEKLLSGARFRLIDGVEENPLRPFRGPLDISRAREELGFAPQYDLERGMRELVEWATEGKN